MNGDLFPIQSSRGAKPHPTKIPWSVAELAYSVYASKYGRGQSLVRLAERGGFGPEEMDSFLPDWRERCDEIVSLNSRLVIAEIELLAIRQAMAQAERFKTFVHSYLDSHGVPHGDPDNSHQKEGCRIGARLDLLFAQRDAAVKRCAGLLCFSCGTHWTSANDKETCRMAHMETWSHEWVPQRVLDLTQKLVEVNAERDAAKALADSLAARVTAQAELLAKRAEKTP